MQRVLAGLLIAGLACVAVDALFWRGHSPETWALTCLCFWSSFLIARGEVTSREVMPCCFVGTRW